VGTEVGEAGVEVAGVAGVEVAGVAGVWGQATTQNTAHRAIHGKSRY
jgi:hypothetical protein